jgi:AcrR family transcriptional regulator
VQPEKRRRGRPTGSRVDPVERRSALLDAAERAIRLKGSEAGISEVAAEAGFGRSAVYAMYPNRDALLAALSERTAQRLLGEITTRAAGSTDIRQRMSLFFDVICAWIAAEPNVYKALNGDQGTGVIEQLAVAVEYMLSTAFGCDDARAPAAAPWSRAIVGSAVSAADWWCRTGRMSRAELVEHLTALCWDGGAALPFLADDIKGIDSQRQK